MAGCVKQGLCVGVLHVAQKGLGGTGFNDASVLHHDDLVRDISDHRKIVRNDQKPHFKFTDEIAQQVQYGCLRCDVERGGRFIRNQQFGAQRDGHRNDHPLTLPA